MKLAAIDIGSNSIHMIVARIDGDGSIDVIDRHKIMARLGEETLTTGYLSEAAQERGLSALREFAVIAEGYGVDDVIAVATSATREARNGADFIRRVEDETGIRARIISGVEEGRLIYLGTREVYAFGRDRALIIDIGGGSVEFILADQRREYLVKSLKLGVRRLKDMFFEELPLDPERLEAASQHIRVQSEAVVQAVRKRGFETLLATSGTANALARLTASLAGPLDPAEPNRVPRDAFLTAVDRAVAMGADELIDLAPIDDRRRDTILPGAILMRTFVEFFGVPDFLYVDAALREGMIVEYLERNRPQLRLADEVPDPRRRSVLLLAGRFYTSTAHAHTVAAIAVRVFDDLADQLRMPRDARQWLEYAAILHNVGYAIHRSAHHKHSQYIIEHGDLSGFTEREQLIMSNIARYHRRSAPKSSHEPYMRLGPDDRDVVKQLSAVLRIANALDRGKRGVVTAVRASVDGNALDIRFGAIDDAAVEHTSLEDQAQYVYRMLGLRLRAELDDDLPDDALLGAGE